MTVTAQIMTVGPDLAQQWLGQNHGNRNVRIEHVNRIAADILDGNWKVTGDAIKLNGDGSLLDGQHRLHAVVAADAPIQTLVVQGIEHDAQVAMDTGAKRLLSDVLKFRGESNAAHLSTSLNWYWRFVNDRMRTTATPSFQQAIQLLQDNPGLRDSVLVGARVYGGVKASPGLMAALHYAASRTNPDDADFFFDALASGVGMSEGHPALLLRTRLVQDAMSDRRMSRVSLAALTVKAWNAYISGRDLRVLKWKAGGMRPEPFPSMTEEE